jgi:PAS domain S-box-containing protein
VRTESQVTAPLDDFADPKPPADAGASLAGHDRSVVARPLKVLIADGDPADAELMLGELRRAGFEPDFHRVDTESEYLERLNGGLDLVLSELQMPKFSGLRALELLKRQGLEVPFILVSGGISVGTAVAAIKNGAADYVPKDRLARLGAAVIRARAERLLRDEERRGNAALQLAEAQLDQLLEHSPAVLYVLTFRGETIVPELVSKSINPLLGFTVAEAASHEWWVGQLHPDDRQRALNSLDETLRAGSSLTEYRMRHKDGHYRWVEDSRRLIRNGAGAPVEMIGVWTDITERKRAEETVRQASGRVARGRRRSVLIELAVIFVATVAVYLLAARYDWFLAATQWLLAHELDRLDEMLFTAICLLLMLAIFAFRRWLETQSNLTRGQNAHAAMELLHDELDLRVKRRTDELYDANQAMRAEVAERRRTEAALRESEGRYHALFDYAPHGIVIADAESRYLDANASICRMLGYTRDELIGLSASDIVVQSEIGHIEPALTVIKSHGDYHREWQFRRKDGSVFPAEVIAAVMPDGNLLGMVRDLSGRRLAESVLKESNRRFDEMLENIELLAMTLDKSGRVTFCNDFLLRLTGWKREEVIGHSWFDRVLPDSAAGVKGLILNNIDHGSVPSHHQNPIKTKTGELREIVWNNTILRDGEGNTVGIASIGEDVTERSRAEAALRESEALFRQVVENIREVFWMADMETNRILYVSPSYEAVWGRARESLYAGPGNWMESVFPEDRERILEAVATKQTRGDYDETYRITRPDGAVRWIRDRAFPIRNQAAGGRRVVGTAEDITEYRSLEDQLRQGQKLEAVGTLAGGIAHDFNNILAAVNGYTELALMNLRDNPKVREFLRSVLQASSRATNLVRQILTFSRQQQQERRVIQLQPVVVECFNLLRASIPSTIEFDLSLATDAPTVLADATQVHQILMNLGTNAWHAMSDRPGRVNVKLERWVVDAQQAAAQSRLRTGVYARVSVSDTGCGMDQATLRRIFEPFFTTKPPGEGTGLGLAVVHGIMDSHDGAVTVDSQPGEGTVFHLYFPAHAGEAVVPAAEADSVPRGHGERILFVDDEELLVRLGQSSLAALGYEVEVATRPATALAMLRADPQRFAVVVTDHTMPGMTGLSLAIELLQIRPGLPIIMTTGYSASLTPERIKAAGIRQLLLKPTTLHSLGSAVHAALSEHPSQASSSPLPR